MTSSRLGRIFFSQFIMWVSLIALGSYFMFTFDKKVLRETPQDVGIIQKYWNAFKLSYLKKGIDLAGGTYLAFTVEIDKALESRLNIEGRNVDTLFKNKGLISLPKDKKLKNATILEYSFEDEKAAGLAINMIREARVFSIKADRDDNMLLIRLSPDVSQEVRLGAVDQAVSVLNNRLGGYGVEGIVVQQHGDRQVVVQLPGVDDPEHIKSVITKTAHLEFKIVEKSAGSKETLLDDFDGDLPSDKMIVPGRSGDEETARRWYLVSAFSDLTGERIIGAKVDFDEFNRPVVSFKLDSSGAREFAELTSNNVGRQLGIIIDNVMFTAPNLREAITGGSGQISGIGSQQEARDLSIVLKSGSLLAPLKIDHENRVGASLGQDSIRRGLMSCLISLLILFIFAVFYYKIPGVLAILALMVNLFLTMLFLSYFRATLTLPGIAGLVLTIGMAIDASILIYERIKEELKAGKPLRSSITFGFSDAMTVILDSNITTFLTGMILFQFGGPAIRGFAVTLMAGIIATLLSGVFFLRSAFYFIIDNTKIRSMKF